MSRSLLSQRTAIVAVLAPIVTAGLLAIVGSGIGHPVRR